MIENQGEAVGIDGLETSRQEKIRGCRRQTNYRMEPFLFFKCNGSAFSTKIRMPSMPSNLL